MAIDEKIKSAFERRQTVQLIVASGAVVGVMGGITCLVSVLCVPHLLTPDAALWGVDVALNGTLIAAAKLYAQKRATPAKFSEPEDSVTPSKAVVVAASFNVLGDILLVGYCGMGIMGAAVATVVGQYLCLAILLSKMLRREHAPSPPQDPSLKRLARLKHGGAAGVSGAVRGAAESRVQLRRGLPRMDDLAMFSAAFGPLFTLLTAKNVSYFLIQAVWSLWTVFAFACAPVEQAALAFLPPIKAPNTVLFNLASYPFLSLGLATNTLVGRFLAEGDNERAGKVASHSLILAASLGLVVMAIMLLFGPSLMVLT
eukprot:gene10939-12936_t